MLLVTVSSVFSHSSHPVDCHYTTGPLHLVPSPQTHSDPRKLATHTDSKTGKKELISYKILKPTDTKLLDDLASLVTQAFLDGEPITAACKWTFDDLKLLPSKYLQARAKDGLNIVAMTESGEVVGGIVQGDYVLGEHDLDEYGDAPQFSDLFPLLGEAESMFAAYMEKEGKGLAPGQVVYQFMAGVDKRFRSWCNDSGRSVAQEIAMLSLEVAKEKGYTMMMSEATNPIVQRVCQKAGYDVTSIVVPYSKFKAFEGIDFGKWAMEGVGNGLSVAMKLL